MSKEDAINEMQKYFKDNPEVGLFWYNDKEKELFEVHSMPASSLPVGEFAYPKLHKTIWQKLSAKTRQKKRDNKFYDPIYLSDYTKIPRGKVFYKEGLFYVFVGSWITDKIKNLIEKEFKLQNMNVVFKVDKHWEIGHDWGTENNILNF